MLTSQGKLVADAVRAIGVTEVTYYRWRQEFGGLKGDQVRRLKELEAENARLRRAVSDLTVEKLILKAKAQTGLETRLMAGKCHTKARGESKSGLVRVRKSRQWQASRVPN